MKRTIRLAIVVLLLSIFSSLSGVFPVSAKPFSYLSRIDPVLIVTTCSLSLQSLVDAAAPGAVVTVPACMYRETVTINKPLTLDGQPGAEIRGSDVWSSGWKKRGRYWTRGTVPTFDHWDWPCEPGSNGRCRWPEQVFFDGRPLEQVASNPQSGQFAIDSARRVILADDPRGHMIEVATRQYWIIGQSNNVTIQGFTMKHAATPAQHGALSNNGHDNWTIQNNTLSDAHGAVVGFDGGDDLRLLRNEILRGGQEGIRVIGATGIIMQGNLIRENNTEDFKKNWEAGGIKILGSSNVLFEENQVQRNNGTGIWCDAACNNVTIMKNRVHHNDRMGIEYEISYRGRITTNYVWENGWGYRAWGWGAGIADVNSQYTEIDQNVVAWNADGISVISEDRGDSPPVIENYVHDNTIAATDDPAEPYNKRSLGWLEDYAGVLAIPSSNNRGAYNAYYYPTPEDQEIRFEWPGTITNHLSVFVTTLGGASGRYLTQAESDQRLTSDGIPLYPENHWPGYGRNGWT